VDVASSGTLFDVQGTVSANRQYVTLTLRPRMSKLERMDTVPFERIPEDQKDVEPKPTVQRPLMSVREVRTTVSIPDGETILLGGFVDDDAAAGAGGAAGGGDAKRRELFITVKPKIIVRREREQQAFPLLQDKASPGAR
jgi:hypothetical protein